MLKRHSPTEHLLWCLCRRKHKGALGETRRGQKPARHGPTATRGCCPLAKLEIQNMFSFDWRSLVLFVKETSNTVRKTKLVIAVSGILTVWLRTSSVFFLNCLHCLCYILFSNMQIALGSIHSGLWEKGREGQDRTHRWTWDTQQHENHFLAFVPSTHTLTWQASSSPSRPPKPHHSHWYTLHPPKI